MSLVVLPAAEEEILEAALYYEQQVKDLGQDFLFELERGKKAVLEQPNSWPKVSEKSRRYRLHRFPYGIVYQVQNDEIVVIAVMHLHQRPRYWRGRER